MKWYFWLIIVAVVVLAFWGGTAYQKSQYAKMKPASSGSGSSGTGSGTPPVTVTTDGSGQKVLKVH